MKRFYLLLLFCLPLITIANAQQMVTEVIPLAYRSVSEIIPVVRPLVSPSGTVSGLQGQLVVTATPQQLVQVRKVLSALDKSPVRLLISVRRGNSYSGKQDSASVQGRAGNIAINDRGVRLGTTGGTYHKDKDYLSVQAKSNRLRGERHIFIRVRKSPSGTVARYQALAVCTPMTVLNSILRLPVFMLFLASMEMKFFLRSIQSAANEII